MFFTKNSKNSDQITIISNIDQFFKVRILFGKKFPKKCHQIESNHAPIDRLRQTEQECAVQVVPLTHFWMIWVDLYQKHKFSVEIYNFYNRAQINAKITDI